MPATYLSPPTRGYRSYRPWYTRPIFYIPAAFLVVLIAAVLVYWSILAADLRSEANTFDLTKMEQMESASVILDRNDKIFGQIYVENRETVPYDQLPRDLINAVVAVEDAKFYQHHGYDLVGIIRAALKNMVAGHVRQGASTITQQLARNSFALKEKTFRRKLLEIFLARRIEDTFGKQKIMELYLNRIYFGGGLYGAEAASRGYFSKPAREMTLVECATLAGLIKSPNRLSPWSDKGGSRDARNYALIRMRELGFIDAEKCRQSQAEDLVIGNRQNAQGQSYAVDYIRQQVIAAVGWDRAMNEGFKIHTTIDSDLQKAAEDSVRRNLLKAEQHPGYNHQTYADYAATFKKGKPNGPNANPPVPEYLQGAVIALDNQTGGILALVGGRDFEHNQYDRALQAKRPAGTAMTPFVFAAAFENGMYPGSIVEDSPLDNRVVMIGGTTGILGEWGPESVDNRYEGTLTAREALVKSKNGATVRLGLDTGVEPVVKLCRDAGIRSQLRPYPATFLGSSEVTLAELALAYTVFPNGGSRAASPHILERIEEKDGTVWHATSRKEKQTVIKRETAYEVHSCLVDALASGTGKAAHSEFGLKKMPAAGKTGTAYDFTDALFAGYDSAVTCAVWAGFDKPQKIYRGAFGRELALPVWVDVMNASIGHFQPKEIPMPPTIKSAEICSRSGLLATDKCYDAIKGPNGDTVQRRTTYTEIGTVAQLPTEPCNVHGEPRARLVRDTGEGEFPKAASAVDLKEITVVVPKAPTLLASKDPYNSIRVVVKPSPSPEENPEKAEEPHASSAETKSTTSTAAPTGTAATVARPPAADAPVMKALPATTAPARTPAPDAPVLKAIPVQPNRTSTPAEIRKAVPVGPLDEESNESLINKSATPPPADLDR
ncbi:MAG: PBP1A family penicillin-binding protein [Chthoniobacterales bacterium]